MSANKAKNRDNVNKKLSSDYHPGKIGADGWMTHHEKMPSILDLVEAVTAYLIHCSNLMVMKMMKKYSFLALNLLMILGIGLSQIHAGPEHILSFLETETEEFKRAPTAEAKFAVILKPFNLNYLQELPDGQAIDPRELRLHVSQELFDNGEGRINCDKSNLLMLVISLGMETSVRQFLSVVPDDRINDSVLTAWGFRQPYNPAHMALDPAFPRAQPPSTLRHKLRIIDALGERGADFNFIPPFIRIGIYQNPPLAARQPAEGYSEDVNFLRARALIYGADPSVGGYPIDLTRDWIRSDGNPSYTYYSRLLHPAFDYFVERTNAGRGTHLRPVPAVMAYFEQIARERSIQWPIVGRASEKEEIELRLDKLAAQIQGKQQEINAFRTQSTKKAKGKARHLILIKESLAKEAKALTRRLRRVAAQ